MLNYRESTTKEVIELEKPCQGKDIALNEPSERGI
jgi:hypothetical protein